MDEDNNVYDCYVHTLSTYNDSGILQYIVMSNLNNIENEKLKLVIFNDEFELIKNN